MRGRICPNRTDWKICWNMPESFPQISRLSALNEVYNDKELIELIIKFIVFIKNNTTAKTTYINKKVREFIKDLSELYYAMNKTRNEFVKKYENEINNFGKYNEELMKTIKVNPNTEIYMDLYAQ